MPSADMLLAQGYAQGYGGSGSADIGQHNPLVSRVLLDALADGTSSGPIDALLDTLPRTTSAGTAAATGMDHFGAEVAAVFGTVLDIGHGPAPGAFSADASFHTAFALETITLHHDAPPAAA